jgi:phage-related holin
MIYNGYVELHKIKLYLIERRLIMGYLITALFISLDVLTGLAKAVMTKTWSSTKMREGFFHKMGIIALIVLATTCEYGQKYLELGFSIPLIKGVLTYVCIMEAGSIGENIIALNPALKFKIKNLLKKG